MKTTQKETLSELQWPKTSQNEATGALKQFETTQSKLKQPKTKGKNWKRGYLQQAIMTQNQPKEPKTRKKEDKRRP